MTARTAVGIAYRFLPHYRVAFFSALRAALDADGVDLELCYGADEQDATSGGTLPWARPVRNRRFTVGKLPPLIWQSMSSEVRNADLVVLMQENRILSNFPMIARGMAGRKRVALWGHGQNFEKARDTAANRFKRLYSRNVHWWFAYTEGVANAVAATGFPRARITIVENAVDTAALRCAAEQIESSTMTALRRQLGLGVGPIAISCGRLYERKRTDFLLEASALLRKRLPSFELIVIGDGTDAAKVRAFAALNPWVHYVGPHFNTDIVPFFRLAEVCLVPGVIGLTILDAFALETPPITTRRSDHGPEIEYLSNGQNGIMAENTTDAFVDAAAQVMSSPERLAHLKRGCRESANHYTLQNMVSNFRSGVHAALLAKS